ncbi:spore coat protein [Virgibacillus ainsalahensis]
MSDSSNKKTDMVPDKVVELMISNIFKKNGVKPEEMKKNLPDDQKQMLKEVVEDLRKQVEQFNNGEKNTRKSSE